MPVRFDQLTSPQGVRFPSCYARLWNFSREAAGILGERIFQVDIDVVITADLAPLIDRFQTFDFVGWSDKRFQKNKIAGGAYLLRTGSLPHVWEEFDPIASPAAALAAGHLGSDQAWMSYKISPLLNPPVIPLCQRGKEGDFFLLALFIPTLIPRPAAIPRPLPRPQSS